MVVKNTTILNSSIKEGSFGVEFVLSDPDGRTADWEPSELDLNNFTKTARNFLIRQPEFLMTGKHSYSLDGDTAEFDGPLVHSLDLIGPFAVTSCTRTGENSFIVNVRNKRLKKFVSNSYFLGCFNAEGVFNEPCDFWFA